MSIDLCKLNDLIRRVDSDPSNGIRKVAVQSYLRGVRHGINGASIDIILESIERINE